VWEKRNNAREYLKQTGNRQEDSDTQCKRFKSQYSKQGIYEVYGSHRTCLLKTHTRTLNLLKRAAVTHLFMLVGSGLPCNGRVGVLSCLWKCVHRPLVNWSCRNRADCAAGLRLYFSECEIALYHEKLTVKKCMYCMLQQHIVNLRA